jgi:hypothetical protein
LVSIGMSIILQICRTYGLMGRRRSAMTTGRTSAAVDVPPRPKKGSAEPFGVRWQAAQKKPEGHAVSVRATKPGRDRTRHSCPTRLPDRETKSRLQCSPHLWASRRKTKALEAKRRSSPAGIGAQSVSLRWSIREAIQPARNIGPQKSSRGPVR